jgi:hypothetical protein
MKMTTISTWAETMHAWQVDAAAREAHTRALAHSTHAAFAWETTPVSAATRDRPFEQVVVESPALARASATPGPFSGHFRSAREDICVFPNLGGDALLVVPAPTGSPHHYAHLAAFVRHAPAQQIHALWSAVGRAVEEHWRARNTPVWVSTAGLGVHWVHVRLDERPKYYRHSAFRRFEPARSG